MPSSSKAIEIFQKNDVLFAPAKAANAGGFAVSGLEMAQNSQREEWDFEIVDNKLHRIMENIYNTYYKTSKEYDDGNLLLGANIGDFLKVAKAMLGQGVV